MKVEDLVRENIITPITNAGYHLDEVLLEKEGGNMFLRVIIDKEGAVDIEDCVNVNKIVSPILDDLDPILDPYILDVCSKEKGCE